MGYKIKDICEINRNNLSKKDNLNYINYLDTANLNEGTITELQKLIVGKDKIPSRAKRKVCENDILVSTVRPNQKHYGIIKQLKSNLIASTGFAVLTPNKKIVDAEYLYRFLTQKTITTYLQAVAESSTSAYPSIKPSIIEDLEIDLPPIREQKSIAHILSTLDDKIEVNNQINRTLEEMAQTIFKHWFVDFEFPNEQGKPYKSSGGEMVESELGMIPKGWEVKKNSDVLKLNYGKALKSKDRQPGKYPVYGSNGIVGFHNKYLVDGPSIVVGRKGNPGTVNYVRDSFFPIDTTFYVSSSLSMLFLYFTLKQQKLYEQGTDSAVPGLNRNIAYMNLMLVPSNNVLKRYDVISASIFQIIKNNQEENSKLIEIRDTLLPKLMSGEIRVSVEKAGVGQ